LRKVSKYLFMLKNLLNFGTLETSRMPSITVIMTVEIVIVNMTIETGG
jgi:hypothetical protein